MKTPFSARRGGQGFRRVGRARARASWSAAIEHGAGVGRGVVVDGAWAEIDDALAAMLGQRRSGLRGRDVGASGLGEEGRRAVEHAAKTGSRQAFTMRREGVRVEARGVCFVVSKPGCPLGVGVLLIDGETARALSPTVAIEPGRGAWVGGAAGLDLAVVCHDLRNPLGAVSMAASLLEAGGMVTAAGQPFLQGITRAVRRMRWLVEQLVEQVVDGARAAAPLASRTVDLGDVVRNVVEETRLVFPAVDISVTSPTRSVEGEFDEGRIAQVVANLVTNASVHGAGVVRVEVGGNGREAWVEVWNTRRPMAARPAGLGLGLFIASSGARVHGGTLRARHDRDATVFRLDVPLGGPRGCEVDGWSVPTRAREGAPRAP